MANNRELSQFGAFLEVNSTNSKVGILTDVGVGTSNPLHKLDVNGELGVSPNTAGKSTHVFTTNATDDGRYLLKSNTTTKVDIQANGSSYFNGGNVGFGITTPEQKIHVNGTVLATQLSTGASGTGINVTTNSITGPSTITIDPAAVGDDTGTVEIKGNLTVQGTTTTINSTTVTFNEISLGDDEKIYFGDANDLQIYHDGTANRTIIDDSSGGFKIQSDGNISFTKGVTENLAVFQVDGAIQLYYDNALKFETSSTGITVTGTVVADGLSLGDNEAIYVGDGNDLEIYHDGTNSYISDQGSGELRLLVSQLAVKSSDGLQDLLVATPNGAVTLTHSGNTKLTTSSTGITVTGTVVADGISVGDNEYINIGEGNDLQIYHNGTNSYIEDAGTGRLELVSNGTAIDLTKAGGETLARFIVDGAVELYYDNSKKIETTTSGVKVTGEVDLNSVGFIKTNTATVATTTATTIESFVAEIYRSARFHVQITQGSVYQTSEVLVIHDGATADIIEYGTISTGDYLGTFSATINGDIALLQVNMTSATSASVKVLTNLIAV